MCPLTHPEPSHGYVENKEQRAVAHAVPDVLVADVVAINLMKLLTVDKPRQGLVHPILRTPVQLKSPCVVAVVVKANRSTNAVALVADAARVGVAVKRAVTSALAIDDFDDVNLARQGPRHAVAVRVAKHPERRPDALLAAAVCESDRCLDACHSAWRRRKRVLALPDTAALLAAHWVREEGRSNPPTLQPEARTQRLDRAFVFHGQKSGVLRE